MGLEEADESNPESLETPTRVAVLGYHDFSETETETAMRINTTKFRKQMELIKTLEIPVISLQDFIDWKKGEKTIPAESILITIDDGWKSVYTDAFPILKEMGYPFAIYLYKNYLNGGSKALTTEMVKEMMLHGASVGSHSTSHPYPKAVKESQKAGSDEYEAFLDLEMGESKRFLEKTFGITISTYVYPGGFYTEEMFTKADELGYSHLFTVLPGKVTQESNDQTLPRYVILGDYDRIFDFALDFGTKRKTTDIPAISKLMDKTPLPVSPEPGSIINSRLPKISVDLSTLENIDTNSLTMHVSGYGQVPAVYDAVAKTFSWQVSRRLRDTLCSVEVSWNDLNQSDVSLSPIQWSFQVDLEASYQPKD